MTNQSNTETASYSTDDQPSLGEINVNNSVVASIVRLAALEVTGVCSVGSGFVDGIADWFSKKESDRGVKVTVDPDGGYGIDIRIVVSFGTEIAKTAYQVQMTVRDRVAVMTGNSVKRVNVYVEGVKMLSKADEAKGEGEFWPETPHTD